MTLLKRYTSILFLILLGISASTGQNLYDFEHSKRFAEFLYQSQQYKLAAMEYERLNFMDPGNLSLRNKLVVSYRKSSQYERGLVALRNWARDSSLVESLYREYIKLTLLNGNYHEADRTLVEGSSLPADEADYYRLSSLLLQKEWEKAHIFMNNRDDSSFQGFSELCELARKQKDIKYRKPALALSLSAIVPGLGKVYSHDWKDGIISFLFVATNAFQAYRGFSKDGIRSAYGWIFGTLGLGFYAGNIYGSWKSAADYNIRSEDYLYHDIQNSVYNSF